MSSKPPEIDQRTYEDIVRQIEALAEDHTKDLENKAWKPPGAIEVEPKPELLSGLILNENIPITVEATVPNLTGRILNEDVDLGNNIILKKGTLLNDEQAQNIVQIKKNQSVEVVLYARNSLIDATLAQNISQIKGLKQVKVKARQPGAIIVPLKNAIGQTLAEDIKDRSGSIIVKSGTVLDRDKVNQITEKISENFSKIKIQVSTDEVEVSLKNAISQTLAEDVKDQLGTVLDRDKVKQITEKISKIKIRVSTDDVEVSLKNDIDQTLAEDLKDQLGTVLDRDKVKQITEKISKIKIQVSTDKVEVSLENAIGQTLAEDIKDRSGLIIFKSGTVLDQDKVNQIIEAISRIKIQVGNDAGEALIKVFSRMVKSVSDRLNQVPEKNFLAFLNLIGGQLKPAQPAKVPLTFYLASGSSVDGLVPAHTQVSAPPSGDSAEEIVFETDRELVVTTAQLKAVFVRDPSQDKYSDRTLEATGGKDAAFLAFSGDRPIEHSLYISCPEIFDLPEIDNLNLIISGDTDRVQTLQEKLNWSYWNDNDLKWQPLANSPTHNTNILTFSKLPVLTASKINGQTEKWLRAKFTNIDSNISANLPQITNIKGSIDIAKSNLIPEVCLFNNTPLDLSKDFYPFGEQPQVNDTFCIALHDAYIKPNATITLIFALTKESNIKPKDITIDWEIKEKEEWKKIGTDFNKDAISIKIVGSSLPNFVKESSLSAEFKISETNLPSPSTIIGQTRYWIRARITQGHYGTAGYERNHFSYENAAILSQSVKTVNEEKQKIEVKTITVDYLDLFKNGDKILLLPEKQQSEEHKIKDINPDNKELTLINGIVSDELDSGTRVMRKSKITETIPPTYDPPLVKSLKLTYKFLLEEDAICLTGNDFNYSLKEGFSTKLKQTAKVGDKLLNLAEVEGLTVGDFLTIKNAKNNVDKYQIETINYAKNQVILTTAINEIYAQDTAVNRYFQPFTPTIDREPTLYLGFDKSFDNKTVTLYAQVEPPSPDELATDITSAGILTEAANAGQTTVELSDVTGWQSGYAIEIQTPSNKKKYDSYTISNIDNLQITLNQSLKQNYSQHTPVIYPQKPKLVWEYSSTSGWQPLGVKDETQAFSQRGLIQFIAPADFSKIETFGQNLYWLRVRWQNGNFRVPARLCRILTNTMWAVQATSLKEEVLGSSNADRHQIFVANNKPILLGQQLEVQEGEIPLEVASDRVTVIRDEMGKIESVWVLWQEVADFYGSRSRDRHYILDRQTGEIRFGDGFAGMIPPRGRNNIRLSFYQTGGGKQGNVSSQTVSQLKTTIPYIDKVINLEAAAGGADQEDLERLKERVPKQLRHRDRAVTLDDIADLAYEASTDVAKVKVVTPDLITANFSPLNENFWLDPNQPDISFEDSLNEKLPTIKDSASFEKMIREINRRAGKVKVVILPQSSDLQPLPSLALLKQVETYIRYRCQPTMDLIVTAPKWQEVNVTATVTPMSFEGGDILRNSIKQQLTDFLHPLTGGTGSGWQFGRYPQESDFYAIIQSIAGVDHVNDLTVEPETNSSLDADTLIYSGNHIVNLKQ